jgi:hypothetical protein
MILIELPDFLMARVQLWAWESTILDIDSDYSHYGYSREILLDHYHEI